MEIEDLYGKFQNLFQAGQLEKAVALAKERSTKSRNEARFHLRWADLLEELGLFDEVNLELNFAIRDDPENQDTYRRLSEIYLDNGYPGKAARCYWSIIEQNPASVFECDLNDDQYQRMKEGVEDLINRKEDRVRYYRLCKGCVSRVVISGWGEIEQDEGFEII